MVRIVASALVLVCAAWGQAPTEFEVASIKLAAPEVRLSGGSYMIAPGGRFICQGITVARLMQEAYGVRDGQIAGGPGWISTERYDIEAKAEGWSTPEQLKPLVQALLADRFQLQIHRETKEMPIYALVIAKGGPKFRASTSTTGPGIGGGRGRINARQVTVAMFADRLALRLGRSVVDRTGLVGEFDFLLEWSADQDAGPSIFTALQEQLGLRLEAGRGPVEIIVIDRVAKASEN